MEPQAGRRTGQLSLEIRSDVFPLHVSGDSRGKPTMTAYHIGIDAHKSTAQVEVQDSDGNVVETRRLPTEELESIAKEYDGHEAALEASSNYFAIYDALSEYLDVTVANPGKCPWLQRQKQKSDRKDAKNLARYLRMGEVPESYVPPQPMRRIRSLVRARKNFVDKQGDLKNEVNALLDQNGIVYDGSLWTDEGRAFLEEVALEEPSRLIVDQWLEAIDDFSVKISRLQRKIEEVASTVEELEVLMTAPGVAEFSGLMVYSELGEIERFDRAAQAVSYAGLDPVVRESGDSRQEGQISKEGNKNLRWILYQSASTAVHNVKDPFLHGFYRRQREKGKPKKVAMVATARKLLVALFHMLQKNEPYNPAGVSA
jgi:transposase